MDRVIESDQQLLEMYGRSRSEEAFAEIVRRYCGLVFSAARRQLRSAHLAEEAAQSVFKALAEQAGNLESPIVLSAWLYQVTRRIAVDMMRCECRRQRREQIAFTMNELDSGEDQWEGVMPLLDDALSTLREKDRTAVLLRFFDKKSLQDIGSILSISDDAAQKRISRALNRLRDYFAKRGVVTSASGVSAMLLTHAVEAVPTGLPETLFTASVSAASLPAGGGSLFTIMSAGKLKLALTVVICAGVTTSIWFVVGSGNKEILAELQGLSRDLNLVKAENSELTKLASLARHPQADLRSELDRLRAEVSTLRAETNRSVQLKRERRQIKTAMEDARQDNGPQVQQTLQNDETLTASSRARGWAMAARRYAAEHNGIYPGDLTLVREYLPEGASKPSTNDFEIVSPGSEEILEKFAKASRLLLVRQKSAWRNSDGKWVKAYGFVDGTAGVFGIEDDRFQEWETHHSLPTPLP
jgi:RNA polymerase sigma factor (sigma-70 family)